MFNFKRSMATRAILAIALCGTVTTMAAASPPTNVSPTNYVTEIMEEPIKVHNDRIDLKARDASIVRMQLLTFGTNSTTGWHHHPGMVIVGVESGSIDLWDTNCNRTTYGPGSPNGTVFIEALPHAHQATSTAGALVRVTYIVPSTGAVVPANFRVEEPVPFCASSF
ncbi:MAG TPA: hypothetical protein VFU20_05625 [Sphingomicrobium sp.]|nr:hypothetical protein [Sphingomicrobium sp.]